MRGLVLIEYGPGVVPNFFVMVERLGSVACAQACEGAHITLHSKDYPPQQ